MTLAIVLQVNSYNTVYVTQPARKGSTTLRAVVRIDRYMDLAYFVFCSLSHWLRGTRLLPRCTFLSIRTDTLQLHVGDNDLVLFTTNLLCS